jgi:hypothetical protein
MKNLDPNTLKTILPKLPIEIQLKAKELLDELTRRKKKEKAQENFLDFVGAMWEGFIHGRHHEVMAEAFEEVAAGKSKTPNYQHAATAYEV